MDTQAILAQLHQQRDQLDVAIRALESLQGNGNRPGRKPHVKRIMSAAARAKIAAAQRKRWAAQKRASA